MFDWLTDRLEALHYAHMAYEEHREERQALRASQRQQRVCAKAGHGWFEDRSIRPPLAQPKRVYRCRRCGLFEFTDDGPPDPHYHYENEYITGPIGADAEEKMTRGER